MNRVLLYSNPIGNHFKKIIELTFPKELENKIFAYLPPSGSVSPKKYTDYWKNIANENGAQFIFVNVLDKDIKKQKSNLLSANILLITGGNTFELLYNLRNSGLDKAIIEFSKKDEFVLSGFSAGALVLGPKIDICGLPFFDENEVKLKDLTGLNIIDFEVFPHYEDEYEEEFERYLKTTNNQVRKIRDEEYVIIEK